MNSNRFDVLMVFSRVKINLCMYMYVCMYKLNYFNFSCTSDEKDLSLGFRAFSIYEQTESVSGHILTINKIK